VKKLVLMAAMVMVLGLVLPGCARSQARIPTYNDPTQPITVKSGQEFVIYLPYTPDTGYTWREEYDQSKLRLVESTCVVCQVGQLEFLESQGYGLGGPNSIPPSAQFSRFQALSAGETKVTMAYKNSPTGEAVETQIFTIIIQ